MKLAIVWRNPLSVTKVAHTVQKISSHESGAVYSVNKPDLNQKFELILGAA